MTYFPGEQRLCLDRSRSGYRFDVVHTREIAVQPEDGTLKLRLILDRFSLELFVGRGEQTASVVLFTPEQEDGIAFRARGNAEIDVEKYDLIIEP